MPFRRAARWWMVYGTAADVGCGVLLVAAARREGVSLRAAAGAGSRQRRSSRAASLDVVALVPAAIGSQLLARRLGPDPADPYPPRIRVSRLHGAARVYGLTVWPVLWAVCEEGTYLGYAFPRLERRYGTGRSAALVSLAWAAQHAVMPVLPRRRYALSRVAAMLPVSAAFTSVYLTGGRRLAPLIAAHWTLDLSAASAEATDWQQIALLYGELTPVVEANRAVAVAMAEGPAAGLVILDALAHHPQLRRWAQLYIARAELLRRLGRDGEATDTYRSALELEPAPASCPSWPDVCGN